MTQQLNFDSSNPKTETERIRDLKLRIVNLTEANDELEKENKKLKCSLQLFTDFLKRGGNN